MDLRTPEGKLELGRRIHSAIAEAGFDSLPRFAQALGCSRALIYQYVKGDVLVQADRLQHIGELTGRSLEWFFTPRHNGDCAETQKLREELSQARARVEELEQALSLSRGALAEQDVRRRLESMDLLRRLCLALRRAGDAAGILEHAPRWRELAQGLDDTASRLDAELQLAHAWFEAGEARRAEEAASRVIQEAEQGGLARTAQSARQELVRALEAAGDMERARAEAARLAAEERWWPRWSGTVSLAALHERVGELEAARAHLRAAAEVIEADWPSTEYLALARAYLMSGRANVLLAAGDYRRAAEENEALRALAAQAGLADQLREATLNAGIIALRLGNLAEAEAELSRLADWAAMSADARTGALAMAFQSELHRRSGDLAAARLRAMAAVDAATDAGRGHLLAEAELALGLVATEEGRMDEARYHLHRCRSRCEKLGLHKLGVAAHLALCRSGSEPAGDELQVALAEAQRAGYADLQADALVALARHASPPETPDLCRRAIDLSREGGYFWAAQEAERLRDDRSTAGHSQEVGRRS
jgi:hypothetical protein